MSELGDDPNYFIYCTMYSSQNNDFSNNLSWVLRTISTILFDHSQQIKLLILLNLLFDHLTISKCVKRVFLTSTWTVLNNFKFIKSFNDTRNSLERCDLQLFNIAVFHPENVL